MPITASSCEHGERRSTENAPDAAPSLVQLKWFDSFETGDPDIDRIHRKLIQDCNSLLARTANEASWPRIIAEAKRLVEDCVAHFRLEESVLERARFPRLAEHAMEHQRLEREMRMVIDRLEKVDGSLVDHFEHAKWLGPILIDVIIRNDLDFRSHILNQQGR